MRLKDFIILSLLVIVLSGCGFTKEPDQQQLWVDFPSCCFISDEDKQTKQDLFECEQVLKAFAGEIK